MEFISNVVEILDSIDQDITGIRDAARGDASPDWSTALLALIVIVVLARLIRRNRNT